jgi:hypothetical protein
MMNGLKYVDTRRNVEVGCFENCNDKLQYCLLVVRDENCLEAQNATRFPAGLHSRTERPAASGKIGPQRPGF